MGLVNNLVKIFIVIFLRVEIFLSHLVNIWQFIALKSTSIPDLFSCLLNSWRRCHLIRKHERAPGNKDALKYFNVILWKVHKLNFVSLYFLKINFPRFRVSHNEYVYDSISPHYIKYLQMTSKIKRMKPALWSNACCFSLASG